MALLLGAGAQEPNPSYGSQSAQGAVGIPTFYAESRQIIVEAEVWDKGVQKGVPDRSTTADEALTPSEKGALKHLHPPARGLTPKDFHVFDNGVEQTINYFKEADFPAIDTTNQWRFVATEDGTWGTPLSGASLELPSATYLIGYVPPPSKTIACRAIAVTVPGHVVQVNRSDYCPLKSVQSRESNELEGTKLGARMRKFAKSSAQGVLKISVQASAFWSSGVLRLAAESLENGSGPARPTADYTYIIEVHDSKAPATVHIATEFDLPEKIWSYPCRHNASAVRILGIVYKTSGDDAGQFGGILSCSAPTFAEQAFSPTAMVVPSRFDTQINLLPGDYQVAVVVTDGDYFGTARMPLHVRPLNPQSLTISDIVVGGVLRDALWVLRDAAAVSPFSVVPSPLVSKNVQFFPDSDTPPTLRKRSPLFLYFEIYTPLLEKEKAAISYRVRITDLKTGSFVMNTEPMSAASWIQEGNPAIPIGLKLDTERLRKGSYRVDVRALDSSGQATEWRQAAFTID